MSKLADIFGYHPQQRRWYVDLALGTVAIVATIWAIAGMTSPDRGFDLRLGIFSAFVAVGAILLSSNRLVAIGVVAGYIVVRGVIAFAETGDSRVLILVSVAALVLFLVVELSRRRGNT